MNHSAGHYSSHTHDKHEGHHTQNFLTKFWVVLVLTIPILAYSEIFSLVFGFNLPRFQGVELLMFALGSAVFFYGGLIFVQGAYREMRARLPGMMTLISLAITAAYLFSAYQIIRGEVHTLFWELSTLIAIMLLGHFVEMKAVARTKGALKELATLLPDVAEVVRGEKTEMVPVQELAEGDIIIVRPGGRIAGDGVIVEGKSDINEALITGESKPVSKNTGDSVIAGAINGDGTLRIKVREIGEKTFLAGVMRLVSDAEKSKSRLQILSDRAAFYLTLVAVFSGAVTFFVWIFIGADLSFAVERLVAVLVVACPHALGLAVPLVASISTTMAAKNGFLVRQRLALEMARTINVVLFDKTGTLTKGEFGVEAIIPRQGETKDHVLSLAASVNSVSEHPLAKAIVNKAKERGLALSKPENFKRAASGGARALVGGGEAFVGNERLMAEEHIEIPHQLVAQSKIFARQGKTVVYVADGKECIGSIALGDIIRKESREAVSALKALHIKTAMVTGDSQDVAAWVSGELAIDEYFAKVLPHEKSAKVKTLQEKGGKVAMVGDGVNDAPALTQADLGIAIGAGTNVAIESAGIILAKSDPRDIPKIISLSKLTWRKMIQNLFWATGYNVIALPLAAGVLAGRGIILEPALAAVFMSFSTVIVAGNALLLRSKSI